MRVRVLSESTGCQTQSHSPSESSPPALDMPSEPDDLRRRFSAQPFQTGEQRPVLFEEDEPLEIFSTPPEISPLSAAQSLEQEIQRSGLPSARSPESTEQIDPPPTPTPQVSMTRSFPMRPQPEETLAQPQQHPTLPYQPDAGSESGHQPATLPLHWVEPGYLTAEQRHQRRTATRQKLQTRYCRALNERMRLFEMIQHPMDAPRPDAPADSVPVRVTRDYTDLLPKDNASRSVRRPESDSSNAGEDSSQQVSDDTTESRPSEGSDK